MDNAYIEVECQTVVVDGHKLEVGAERAGDAEWRLYIENIHGIRAIWLDQFETAEAALEAGRRAIETEGVEEFVSKEGFEYLP